MTELEKFLQQWVNEQVDDYMHGASDITNEDLDWGVCKGMDKIEVITDFIQGLMQQFYDRQTLDLREVFHTLDRDEFKKRAVYIFTPLILTIPWSLSLLIHPSRFLLEPGLAFTSDRRWPMLLMNPGGLGAPPIWIAFPFVLFLLVALFNHRMASFGLIGIISTSVAVLLSTISLNGNSTSDYQVFCGPILVFAQLLSLFSIASIAQSGIPNLKNFAFGIKHLISVVLAGLTTISLTLNLIWIVSAVLS